MKIVILDGYTMNPGDLSWDAFKELGEVILYDRTPVNETTERIGGADAVITNKAPVPREVICACPNLKYIGVTATGYNIVDTDAARESGIVVTNVPVYGTAVVAQFAISLLLEICHRVGHHSMEVSAGRWASNPDWCFWDYPLIELAGKTMGVIGYGRIGQAVGNIALALGMEILFYDTVLKDAETDAARYAELDELFARSDVISLHCPLFPETRGMIDRRSIGKMKDGVIIINNSRGPLIVEEDLADALNSGKVYAAGLDVISVEPINADNPLLKAKNCIITPHISWASVESRKRLMKSAADNLRAFIEGKPVNAVNMG